MIERPEDRLAVTSVPPTPRRQEGDAHASPSELTEAERREAIRYGRSPLLGEGPPHDIVDGEIVEDETLGQRLRRLRLKARLSQRELSTEHVSYAYISRVEADARTPSVKALREIAPKLGVSVHYLETGEDVVEVLVDRELAERALALESEAAATWEQDPSEAARLTYEASSAQGKLFQAVWSQLHENGRPPWLS